MKRHYFNLTGKLLLLMFAWLGFAFTAPAIEKKLKFTDPANQPVSNYTFVFEPGAIRATTDASGSCTVNFPDEGLYEIIPDYWERSMSGIGVSATDPADIPVMCPGGIATFALKGLDPSDYACIDPVFCNGNIVHPRWDAAGKWRYLSEHSCLDYNLETPFGSLHGSTCDFTTDIELTFDTSGKQRVTITVADTEGAPLPYANIILENPDLETWPSARTNADGVALLYVKPATYQIRATKYDSESAALYMPLQQEITVTNAPVEVSLAYQGHAACLDITSTGYRNAPLEGAYITLRDDRDDNYSIHTDPAGKARIFITRTGSYRYSASCNPYVKNISGILEVTGLSGTFPLAADFSDCYKITVSVTDIPDVFHLYGNVSIESEDGWELASGTFHYYPRNPEFPAENPCFYMASGSYYVTLKYIQAEKGYTDDERLIIYPIEKHIQVSAEQQVAVSLGGLHKVTFLLNDERLQMNGVTFYKNGKSYYYTSEGTEIYMPDGEYEWTPHLSLREPSDYADPVIAGTPQKFTVSGNDLDVTWEAGAYHKASFSFGGTSDGNNGAYMYLTLMQHGKEIHSTGRDLSPETQLNIYLQDGEYFYEAEVEDLSGNGQDGRELYYGLPRQTGTIRINGNDIQQVISYRDYIPANVEILCNGVKLPFYFIQIKDANDKTVIIDDISDEYKVYLLPGEYRFIATAPLYTTARETLTVSSSTRLIQLHVNEDGGYAAAFYFCDSEYDALEGVEVQFGDYEAQYTDNEGGCIFFDIPAGSTLTLKAAKEGYRPVEQSLLIDMSEEDLKDEESVFFKEIEMEKINSALESGPSAGLGISIYPNPATESFRIKTPETETTGWQLVLTDMSGKQVLTETIGNSNTRSVDITLLPKGLYIVKLYNQNEIRQAKLIKK